MYIAAFLGQTTPGDKILMSTETFCPFGHLLQFSKKSLDFIHYLTILYKYILLTHAPGAGADNPLGSKF